MHQAKKGNNWHFGMKAHIGVDAVNLVHGRSLAAANVSDVSQTHALVHGEESDVFGDAGYQASRASWRIRVPRLMAYRNEARQAQGATKGCDGKAHGSDSVRQHRAKVEHPLSCSEESLQTPQTLPRSGKNEAQLFSLFGLRNLMLARKRLMALDAQGTS